MIRSQATAALEEVFSTSQKVKLEAKIKRWKKGLLVQACGCRGDIWSLVHESCLARWKTVTSVTKCPQCSESYAIPDIPEIGEEAQLTMMETAFCVLSPGDVAREDNHILDLRLDKTKRGLAVELSKDNLWYGKPRSPGRRGA